MKYNIPEDDYDIGVKKRNTEDKSKPVTPPKPVEQNGQSEVSESKSAIVPISQEVKRRGRPAKPTVKASITIEEDLTDIVDAAASLRFKGNRSAYINSLIRKDFAENADVYNSFLSLQIR